MYLLCNSTVSFYIGFSKLYISLPGFPTYIPDNVSFLITMLGCMGYKIRTEWYGNSYCNPSHKWDCHVSILF